MAGFLLGYWVVGLVTVPLLLVAMDVVPSYSHGVALVLDRSGAVAASRQLGFEVTHLRDYAMGQVNEFLGAAVFAEASATGQ